MKFSNVFNFPDVSFSGEKLYPSKRRGSFAVLQEQATPEKFESTDRQSERVTGGGEKCVFDTVLTHMTHTHTGTRVLKSEGIFA